MMSNIEWLKKELPRLLREDDEVRGIIIDLVSQYMPTKEDIKKLREDMLERFERMDQRFEKMDQRFEKMDERFIDITEILKKMQLSIVRIESKEGKTFEKLVRELLSETLKLENIDPNNIKRVFIEDKEGEIFYKNYSSDIDILIKNGDTCAIELKATANSDDIAHFTQNIKLYELNSGKKVTKSIIAALRIRPESIKTAEDAGVKLIWGEIISF